MRLTTDLINSSISCTNPIIQERELYLRGHKISAIENMGPAKSNQSVDLTDNDISLLGNFPLYPELNTLLLAQNRITAIQSSLSNTIPNVKTLVLTKNRLAELADLDPLAELERLVYLSLLGNPVCSKEHYRLWVIWRIPSVRFLDFTKVPNTERIKAKELFGTKEEPTELASKLMGIKSSTAFVVPTRSMNGTESKKEMHYTEDEKRRFKAMIEKAGSLTEMAKLEKDFQEGRIPAAALAGAEPMEV